MRAQFRMEQLRTIAAVLVLASAQWAPAQQAMPAANENHALAADSASIAPSAPAKPAPVQQEEESAPGAGKQSGDGIKVHGHWVLAVKNPDGKLVERREFDNSLVTAGNFLSGDQLLVAILSGDLTPGGLGIALITGSTPAMDQTALCQPSILAEPTYLTVGCYSLIDQTTLLWGVPGIGPFEGNALGAGNNLFWPGAIGGVQTGLATSVNFAPTPSIVLSGNFTVGCTVANVNTSECGHSMAPVTAVQTWMVGCGNEQNVFGNNFVGIRETVVNQRFTGTSQPVLQASLASNSCNDTGYPAFQNAQGGNMDLAVMGVLTSTTVPNGPLTVTTGQVITVTVTLSFS